MRKNILLFLMALLHLSMQAQEFIVNSFVAKTNDLAASTYERKDSNGVCKVPAIIWRMSHGMAATATRLTLSEPNSQIS